MLFIDEAYALLDSSAGREALATLVKAMEDRKGEFVVMLAGYDREMRELLEANSGLASRVGYTFRFDDYDTDELLEMFMLKMGKAGFRSTTKLAKPRDRSCATSTTWRTSETAGSSIGSSKRSSR